VPAQAAEFDEGPDRDGEADQMQDEAELHLIGERT
jgi:hypothetical protein